MLGLLALLQAAAPITGLPLPESPQWLERPTAAEWDQARPKAGPDRGEATILCSITAEGRLSPCQTEEETPTGGGFGPAALSLASKYRMAGATQLGEPVGGHWLRLRIRFTPLPPPPPEGVAPIVKPKWISRPAGPEFSRYYPDRALRMEVTGSALVQCIINEEGRFGSCVLLYEDPPEFGFGDAALRMMPFYQMEPLNEDGEPVAGKFARMPINFNLPRD